MPVRAVDVDQGHVQNERGEQRNFHTRERILDHFCGAVFERIGAEHGTGRQERDAHRRGFHPPRDGAVRPLDALLHLPRLDRPPQCGRGAVDLQPDVGDVQLFDQSRRQPQVKFEYALSADAQIPFVLTHHLARQRHRTAHRAVQFRADVATVVHEAADRLPLGHELVFQFAGFLRPIPFAELIQVIRLDQFAHPRVQNIHGALHFI